jgi:carboxyl-terminal processing protease
MGIFKPRYLAIATFSALSLALLPQLGNAVNDSSSKSYIVAADQEQKLTSIEILNALKSNHYTYIDINDSFSNKLLEAYIKQLDTSKSYFLKTDIDEFQQYRDQLDDALNRADLRPAFMMFSRYQQRVEARLNWLLANLDESIGSFDFSVDENFKPFNKDGQWASSPAELDELWRKRLKNNVLDLRLTGKADEDIIKLLKKRFDHQLKRLQRTNSNDAFDIYMNTVTLSYDPHTQYLAPHQSENFNITMSRSLEGIGAVLQYDQEYTKVVRLVAGGPADEAGELHPADRIVGVAQGDEEIVNVIGWRLDEVVNLIRGPKDTVVRLQVIPSTAAANQAPTEISIVRNRVQLEDQKAKKQIIEIQEQENSRKIGIINIPDFYMDFDAYQRQDPNYVSTTRDVRRLLEELKQEQVDGVIIDLRNNGGGSLPEVNTLVGLFIDKGATVQIKDRNGRVNVLSDYDSGVVYDGPLAVMVNRLSASASEIFAGAIQDYQRGIVLGSQTFGKGTVQTLVPLRQGQLKITRSKFYRISGATTQHQGVLPDIHFPGMIDVSEIGEDALDNALPWDTIRPVLHRKSGQLTPFIAQLEERHDKRVEGNADYQFRLDQIEKIEQNRQQMQVSLNEAARKQQQDDFDNWQLAVENTRREAKGLAKIENLSELEEKDDKDNAANDPYLMEGAHILTDLIELSDKQIAQYL